ncbi:MAG: hypothetical protein HY953_03690, partial [Candidatus Rokubacteria bacterium]|nr:hypothetical protein [Candidatus Rokubacteria bacterium]
AQEEVGELIRELKTMRETLSLREREIDESRARLSEALALQAELNRQCERLRGENDSLQAQVASSSSSDSETMARLEQQRAELQSEAESARTENVELRAQMAEIDGQLQAYRSEFQTIEKDEATTRALAERLAREKAALEKRRKDEMAAINAEVARLRADLESARSDAREENRRFQETSRRAEDLTRANAQLQGDLSAERDEHTQAQTSLAAAQHELKKVQAELERLPVAEKELAEARLSLATERSRAGSLERLLADAKTQLERARQKERELRRLVTLVTNQEEDVVVVDDSASEPSPAPEEAEAPPPNASATPPPAPLESLEELGAADPAPEPEPAPEPAPEEPAIPLPGASSLFDTEAVTESLRQAMALPEEPAQSPEESSGGDLDIAIDEEGESKGPSGSKKLSAWDFGRQLRQGALLVRTEWFERYQPSCENETRLAAWLGAADSFSTLLGLARGTMTEETLTVLCFQFYEKGLVDVSEAVPEF